MIVVFYIISRKYRNRIQTLATYSKALYFSTKELDFLWFSAQPPNMEFNSDRNYETASFTIYLMGNFWPGQGPARKRTSQEYFFCVSTKHEKSL